MKRILTLFCVLAFTSALQAQTDSGGPPPLPPGPLIQKRAPDMAKWVITAVPAPANNATANSVSDASSASDPQSAGAKQKVASEVTITKTGKIMLREVRTQDGRVVPTWCVGGLQITLFGNSAIVQAKVYNPDPTVPTANYEDYSDSDFPGFYWIGPSNYTDIKEFGGKKCIVFQEAIKNVTGPPSKLSAYIDFLTRLPVSLTVGGGTSAYVFKAPPTAELTLPPLVVQLLRNRQRELDSATPRSQMH